MSYKKTDPVSAGSVFVGITIEWVMTCSAALPVNGYNCTAGAKGLTPID